MLAFCVCGDPFNVDHPMVCRHGGFIIKRHNDLRDLEAEMLNIVHHEVEIKLVPQDVTGEMLLNGTNKIPDCCVNIHVWRFWILREAEFCIL